MRQASVKYYWSCQKTRGQDGRIERRKGNKMGSSEKRLWAVKSPQRGFENIGVCNLRGSVKLVSRVSMGFGSMQKST